MANGQRPGRAAGVLRRGLLPVCRARAVPLGLRRRLGRLLVPYSEREYELDIDGVAYRGRLDNYIEWSAYVTGQFYEFSYLNLVRSFGLGGCALDIGANVGNHTAALSTMFDEVLAFEPYRPLYERLLAKTERLPGARAYRVGLGAVDARLPFAAPSGRNLGTGRVGDHGETEVPIAHGDRFLAGRHEHPVRFIKIDVEGFELEVLRGLARTLERHRPVVMYEVAHKYGGTSATSYALFPERYRFWALKGQSTFPLQRQVARPVALRRGEALRRRYTYLIACPEERSVPSGL